MTEHEAGPRDCADRFAQSPQPVPGEQRSGMEPRQIDVQECQVCASILPRGKGLAGSFREAGSIPGTLPPRSPSRNGVAIGESSRKNKRPFPGRSLAREAMIGGPRNGWDGLKSWLTIYR